MQPTHLHLVRSACLYTLRRAPADVVQLHGSNLRNHRFTSWFTSAVHVHNEEGRALGADSTNQGTMQRSCSRPHPGSSRCL